MVAFPLEPPDSARLERARPRRRSTPHSQVPLTTHPARALGSRRGVVFVREVQCHEWVARHDWFTIPLTVHQAVSHAVPAASAKIGCPPPPVTATPKENAP